MSTTDKAALYLRVPVALKDRLRALARARGLSDNALVIVLLDKAIRDAEKDEKGRNIDAA